MKKMILLAIMGMVLFGGSQKVLATSFSSTIDWDSPKPGAGTYPYLEIEDSFSYQFILTGLNSSDYDLLDAKLELMHHGNSNTPGEVWFSYGENGITDILIGQLSGSSGSNWVSDTWQFTWQSSPEILNLMESNDPWRIIVNLVENTTGTDKLKIDYSTLSGNYNGITQPEPPTPPTQPVPEPSTLFLFGAGLVGVGLLRKRFKR